MQKRLVLTILVMLVCSAAAQATVQITIYNDNLALVKDTRDLTFERGRFELSFTDVASAIDPTSVAFTVTERPDAVTLLEQNYRYDLVSSEKVLQKFLDRPIQIITRQDKLHEGTLMSVDPNALTLQLADGGIRIVNREQIADLSLARLPEGLITRPTLVWLLDADVDGSLPAEVRYLTHQINWHAEYVATVSADETALELAGWVSIDNKTGATYEDASIKLIAGDVHMVQPERKVRPDMMAMERMAAAAPSFEQKEFFEYHLYTLTRPSTLRDNEIKQLALFDPARVSAKKVFTYNGQRDDKKVRVTMEFENAEEAGLGMPLPKGKIRVMKADTDGSLEFVGEDRIDHTPKDEKVRVYLGNAFDVVGERKVMDHRRITDRISEDDIEISLRNHKSSDITVVVEERVWGDWTILNSSHAHRKKDANTAEWSVQVPRDGEVLLKFTVRRTS
jgi:hypothetical protein